MKRTVLTLALTALAATAGAQDANPLTKASKAQWDGIKTLIVKSAEQVPDADYTFRPTETVRTFGQLVAHLADDHVGFCAAVSGDKTKKFGDNEKAKRTSKAEILPILKESVAYCDSVFAKLDDKTMLETMEFFGTKQPKVSVLAANTGHDQEHYGNMVTYMRIKGLVPPSSQPSK